MRTVFHMTTVCILEFQAETGFKYISSQRTEEKLLVSDNNLNDN